MKVLMYGWEFPPRISGGLGVACYAIVKELARKNVGVTLVLPYDVKDILQNNNVKLLACDNSSSDASYVVNKELEGYVNIQRSSVSTYLHPYVSERDFTAIVTSMSMQTLAEILSKLSIPDMLKQYAIDAAHGSIEKQQITGKYGLTLLSDVLQYALTASHFAKTVNHDVIHAHDWLTILAAIEAKKYSNKPLVFHIHALEIDRSGVHVDKRIFAIEKYGMEQADRVITVSQYTKNIAVQYYGITPEKISVVHNGTYCDDCNQLPQDHKGAPMVLFLGRITHQKGPYYFIEIAKKILSYRNDVQFVIAGTGDLLVSMIDKVAAARIGKNVHFTGFLNREEVQKILQLTDVYVMPSVSEPFGLSCLEALTNRVPVVISKQSGVSEVLRHTLVADFWDVDDMAAKILVLLKYKALQTTSINNSQGDLKALTWEHAAAKIINVYHEVQGS